jgi:hypothetical protein
MPVDARIAGKFREGKRRSWLALMNDPRCNASRGQGNAALSMKMDTTPDYPKQPSSLVEAAEFDLAAVLHDMPNETGNGAGFYSGPASGLECALRALTCHCH